MPRHVVTGPEPPRTWVVSSPRFVGRGQELAALETALATPPAVALIEGEAGIGKSRLLQEFLTSPAGREHHVLVAGCPPFHQPHTLGPVADALRQAARDVAGLPLSPLAGALRPLFPEWADSLPPAPEPAEDASAARHRVFRALDELLGSLEIGVLAAEDVHWADEATLEFLLYLASRRPQQVSLVVTYRPEDVPAGSLLLRLASRPATGDTRLRLALGPLDVVGTAGLVSSMLTDQHVSDEFATFVHERTEGVPLAVEESVRLMGDRYDVARRRGGWVRRPLADIDVPPTIRDSVRERVGRFSPAAQAVLQAAAVLAEPAGEAVLTAVSGLAPAEARTGLSVALGSGLLAEDGRELVSFRHVLAARAVYDEIPAPQRRALHRQAAQALEGLARPPVAQLARHFREAAEIGKWRHYGEQSVELALAAGDEATAAVLLCELLNDTGLPIAPASRLLDKLAFGSLTAPGRYQQDLLRALREALAAGNMTAREEGVARFHIGRILGLMGDQEANRAELERAIPLLAEDPERAARAMTILGFLHDTSSPARVYLRWLRRAATLTGSLEPTSALRMLIDRVTSLLLLGEEQGWGDAARLPADSLSAEERQAITIGQLNVGDLAEIWGRYGEARRRLTTALTLAETHQYQRYRQMILMVQAHLDWLTGHWAGLAERVRLVAGDGGDQLVQLERLDAILVSGLLHAAAGAHAEAADQLHLVVAERKRLGQPAYTTEPAAALAWLELAAGRAEAALAVTEEPITVVVTKGIWLWASEVAPARVAALIAAGRTGEAAGLVTAFGQGLRARRIPAARAGLALCRAILAESHDDPGRAAAAFGRAAAAWQGLPRPYDALLAREREAGCLLAAGRTEAGLTLLQQVAQGLTGLGARDAALRVTGTLRRHGVAVRRPSAGRPGYGDRLSPRELEVARLLVGGRTNREIAQQLYLSPKTVARHVESAMRKLDVSSRTALAVRVVETDLVDEDPGGPRPPGLFGSFAQ